MTALAFDIAGLVCAFHRLLYYSLELRAFYFLVFLLVNAGMNGDKRTSGNSCEWIRKAWGFFIG